MCETSSPCLRAIQAVCTEHKETNNRVLRMGGVRAQGMLERHCNTCPRRGSSKTGLRHVAGHNRVLPGSRQEQKARGHHPLITTNNVPHSPQLHFWIVTSSHVPPASPVAVFPGPGPCNVWPWPGEVPASPRGEALFRCARPSGVPRGPATSTGSLASLNDRIFSFSF